MFLTFTTCVRLVALRNGDLWLKILVFRNS